MPAPHRSKLKMLEPRLTTLPDRVATLHTSGKAKRTGRDADPRRTLPLNGAAWQRLRASVLASEPLCRDCTRRGIVEPATDVDHADGNPGNNDGDNLVSLCHGCHSRKTARDHGKAVRYGCDATGHPADPSHPWNRSGRGLPGASPGPSKPKITSNRLP